jgi:hypothetical protein
MSEACPTCGGDGTNVAAFIIYAPGHGGPPARVMQCHSCGGAGMVSKDHAERMRIGENYRDYRTNGIGLTLRSAAAEWGMSPSELSYIEQGKTITDWSPPGWAEWAKGE